MGMMGIPKRELVILGGLMAVTAILYIFVLTPMAATRASLTEEAKRLSAESQKIQATLETIPKGRIGLEEARTRMEEIRARLVPNLSTLFSEISRPSKNHRVGIVSFTPKDPDPTKYGEVAADLVVKGTYLELGQYLEELVTGPYLIAVDSLKISAVKPGDPDIRMHVILKSWIQQGAS